MTVKNVGPSAETIVRCPVCEEVVANPLAVFSPCKHTVLGYTSAFGSAEEDFFYVENAPSVIKEIVASEDKSGDEMIAQVIEKCDTNEYRIIQTEEEYMGGCVSGHDVYVFQKVLVTA